MNQEHYSNYNELSIAVSTKMIDTIKSNKNALICVATGNTPIGPYAEFVKEVKNRGIDCGDVRFVGLDEWLGLEPEHEGTCHHFLHKHLFIPLGIKASQYKLFNGMCTEWKDECAKMDEFLQLEGPVDLMLLGIGMNGHLGFNEPGTPWRLHSHVIDLDPTTQTVGQQYFSKPMTLKKGITLGPADILSSKKILLMANGTHKKEIIMQLLNEPPSTALPASVLVNQDAVTLMTDILL
jgi:glucosamine-6-phosphate isomerase